MKHSVVHPSKSERIWKNVALNLRVKFLRKKRSEGLVKVPGPLVQTGVQGVLVYVKLNYVSLPSFYVSLPSVVRFLSLSGRPDSRDLMREDEYSCIHRIFS